MNEEGVIHVRNANVPILEADAVEVRSLWSLDISPGLEDGKWDQPDRLVAAFDRLYVLDRELNRVAVISDSGTFLSTFGRTGHGPGELVRPNSIAATARGIEVEDGGQGAIVRFDSAGRYLGRINIPALTLESVPLSDNSFAVQSLQGQGWLLVDSTGRTQPLISDVPVGVSTGEGVCTNGAAAGGFLLLAACRVPAIAMIDLHGEVRRVFTIDEPVHRPSESEMVVFKEYALAKIRSVGLSKERSEQILNTAVAANQVKLYIRRAAYDPAARLFAVWQQNPVELGDGNAVIHLLSEQGFYLARLVFEESFTDIGMSGGRLYAITSDDETGAQALKAYEITLPQYAQSYVGRLAAKHRVPH